MKKNAQRQVSMRHPPRSTLQRAVEHDVQERLPERDAGEQRRREQEIDAVSLILIKRLVVEDQSVSEPKTSTMTAVTSGMIGMPLQHHVG